MPMNKYQTHIERGIAASPCTTHNGRVHATQFLCSCLPRVDVQYTIIVLKSKGKYVNDKSHQSLLLFNPPEPLLNAAPGKKISFICGPFFCTPVCLSGEQTLNIRRRIGEMGVRWVSQTGQPEFDSSKPHKKVNLVNPICYLKSSMVRWRVENHPAAHGLAKLEYVEHQKQ